jgi:hypothetical protein
VAEKHWEGCGGLEITEEHCIAIAAQAALLLLELNHDYFRRVQSILVYPHEFVDPRGRRGEDGIVRLDQSMLGEAHYDGPVVLSWSDVLKAAELPHSGHHVVLHEFAHQLDMNNRGIDGTPALRSRALARRWAVIMQREFRQLRRDANHGRATLLDHYGATNEPEFFAVTTECFFTEPRAMRAQYAELYDLFREYYGQDPARWGRASENGTTENRSADVQSSEDQILNVRDADDRCA